VTVSGTEWFVPFSSSNFSAPNGDGRPWGDGTEMAARANPASPSNPWDVGCTVTTFLGGQAAMDEYNAVLNQVIDSAQQSNTAVFANGAWTRGHVYIVDWRFNCLRDVSANTNAWGAKPPPVDRDNVAIGLVRRLMQAGVQVRLLLWYPGAVAPGFGPHKTDHHYAAQVVEAENRRLMTLWNLPADADPLGVVALDMRIADGQIAGSLHQKMMVVRTPTIDVAFAGGVDLAYTRRDAPLTLGDWQSGTSMPAPGPAWPRQHSGVDYSSLDSTKGSSSAQKDDLPEADTAGNAIFGARQSWHDQHLKVTGPIVATLEWQFTERWRDTSWVFSTGGGPVSSFLSGLNLLPNQVILSADQAVDAASGRPRALPPVKPAAATGSTAVQMWRTIPWRNSRPDHRSHAVNTLYSPGSREQSAEPPS
jgi:hypothetical protein